MTDIEVVEAIYAAMAGADIEGLLALTDPNCVITQDERLPWGGRHEGHDGLGAFVTALLGNISSQVEIEALYEADGEVIQVGRTRGTTVAGGTPFDIPEVHRWVIRDGKAVQAHFAIDTPAMLAALAGES
jgi:ketosteroid isomerase-like protein